MAAAGSLRTASAILYSASPRTVSADSGGRWGLRAAWAPVFATAVPAGFCLTAVVPAARACSVAASRAGSVFDVDVCAEALVPAAWVPVLAPVVAAARPETWAWACWVAPG